jgi:dTDP-glucose pyrophosphorylase/predicted transcriptional regulator
MKDWKKITAKPDNTIVEVIDIINRGNIQFSIVLNENNQLLGSVTDGDIRRGILNNTDLNSPVSNIMNTSPYVCTEEDDEDQLLKLMRSKDIHQIPILNKNKEVLGIRVQNELLLKKNHQNLVVIMAGGLGKRLGKRTEECPKPLLKVGEIPILETIIKNFKSSGFSNFVLSVNYKSEMIDEYFGQGEKFGVNIDYIEEEEPLGTAGSLSLLRKAPNAPIIVMNGDLLTKINFSNLLDYHQKSNSVATMCVREYDFQVPYGVVHTEDGKIQKIEEKPVHNFFVNAGIYVLDSDILQIIPKQTYFDMPSLFEKLIKTNKNTSVFPVCEYWIDIGREQEFKKANIEFSKVFE